MSFFVERVRKKCYEKKTKKRNLYYELLIDEKILVDWVN